MPPHVAVDTAASVAGEMVADLELTPEDAAVIAATIGAELARLSDLPEIDAHASLSLTTVRPLTPGDVRALQEAAHALLGALAARGLVPAAADKESP